MMYHVWWRTIQACFSCKASDAQAAALQAFTCNRGTPIILCGQHAIPVA